MRMLQSCNVIGRRTPPGFRILLILLVVVLFQSGTDLAAQERPALLLYADSLRLAGAFDSAVATYDLFLSTNSDDRHGLYGRGVARIYRDEIDAGTADLQRALAIDPACSRCYYWLGRVAAQEGNPEVAMRLLQKAIDADSTDADFWSFRAHLHSSGAAALRDFNKAVELDPTNVALVTDRANFYLGEGSLMMALQDINKALSIDSTFAYTYVVRSEFYLARGDTARALAEVTRAIQLGNDNASTYWRRAHFNEWLGNIDSAIADYNAAIQRAPEKFELYHGRAMVRFSKEDMSGVCQDLDKALELIGDNQQARAIAIVAWNNWCDTSTIAYFSHRGIADYNLGNYHLSVDWYNKGLKRFPESLTLRYFRGNAAFAMEDHRTAVQDYEHVLSNFDRYFDEWWSELRERQTLFNKEEARLLSRSTIFSMLAASKAHSGDHRGAIALLDSAIANERDPTMLYNQRGLVNAWFGELKAAVKDFEWALSFTPNEPGVMANRALAYLIQATSIESRHTRVLGFGVSINGGGSAAHSWPVSDRRTTDVDLELVKTARADLDRVIASDPTIAQAYEYRAYARKLLGDANYCEDMVKARTLGPESGLDFTPECR